MKYTQAYFSLYQNCKSPWSNSNCILGFLSSCDKRIQNSSVLLDASTCLDYSSQRSPQLTRSPWHLLIELILFILNLIGVPFLAQRVLSLISTVHSANVPLAWVLTFNPLRRGLMWPGEWTFSWFGPELAFLFYAVCWSCQSFSCFRTNILIAQVLGP